MTKPSINDLINAKIIRSPSPFESYGRLMVALAMARAVLQHVSYEPEGARREASELLWSWDVHD